jgi:hypothetical protein
MNKRLQKSDGPLSQLRYMTSPEYAELRGVNALAVSARAAILLTQQKKNFIWWLQGMSLAEGGLKRLARELVEMFPDRIRSDDREFALSRPSGNPYYDKYEYRRTQTIEQFLVDLCINPRIQFALPGDDLDVSDIELDKAVDAYPELSKCDFSNARLDYFFDIIGALFEFKARSEAKARESFQLTAIGKSVWETLNFALTSRSMVVVDGLEGRGKTQAVKAWCAGHLGTARFVSLKGITSKTLAFREISRALGISFTYTRTGPDIQMRIEDVLKRSKLMLVVDEAHYVFNQSRKMTTRPELVDWIDTAICNQGVGISLITTPQFIVCMTRAADQVEWNYRQFRRRVKRWNTLPEKNTEADIRAVARNVFEKANAQMISKIVGYALLSKRDLSAIGDVADEVRVMLGTDDLSKATPDHIHRAIYDFLLPSDKTFLEGMAAARSGVKKPVRKSMQPLPPIEATESAGEAPEECRQSAIPPTRGVTPVSVPGSRIRAGNNASLIEA